MTNTGTAATAGLVTVTEAVPTGLTATGLSRNRLDLHPAGGTVYAQRRAGGRGRLSRALAVGQCREHRAGQRDEHGDGERRRRDEHRQQHREPTSPRSTWQACRI